jgi:hypothetical protein
VIGRIYKLFVAPTGNWWVSGHSICFQPSPLTGERPKSREPWNVLERVRARQRFRFCSFSPTNCQPPEFRNS